MCVGPLDFCGHGKTTEDRIYNSGHAILPTAFLCWLRPILCQLYLCELVLHERGYRPWKTRRSGLIPIVSFHVQLLHFCFSPITIPLRCRTSQYQQVDLIHNANQLSRTSEPTIIEFKWSQRWYGRDTETPDEKTEMHTKYTDGHRDYYLAGFQYHILLLWLFLSIQNLWSVQQRHLRSPKLGNSMGVHFPGSRLFCHWRSNDSCPQEPLRKVHCRILMSYVAHCHLDYHTFDVPRHFWLHEQIWCCAWILDKE